MGCLATSATNRKLVRKQRFGCCKTTRGRILRPEHRDLNGRQAAKQHARSRGADRANVVAPAGHFFLKLPGGWRMLGRWLLQRLAGGGRHAHVDACAHSRRRIWVAHRRATSALLLLVLGARWPSLLVSGLARRLRVVAPMDQACCACLCLLL